MSCTLSGTAEGGSRPNRLPRAPVKPCVAQQKHEQPIQRIGLLAAVWPQPPQLQLTLLCESEGEVRELAMLWLRRPLRLCYHAEIAAVRCSCQVP
jgi:hypothetical protein